MSSFESIMFQLTSGLVNETVIPVEYFNILEINNAIIQYNWIIKNYDIPGWITLVRYINYSS
jgi:hypothetical protein